MFRYLCYKRAHRYISTTVQIISITTDQNRAKFIPIIEWLILCGRQEIALRGHRDSEKINVNGR